MTEQNPRSSTGTISKIPVFIEVPEHEDGGFVIGEADFIGDKAIIKFKEGIADLFVDEFRGGQVSGISLNPIHVEPVQSITTLEPKEE